MRGIAALCVLFHHLGQRTAFPLLTEYGVMSVDLFFMISGFVIAMAYENKFASMTLPRFAAIRVVRLYPALLVGLILCAVVAIAFPGDTPRIGLPGWLLQSLVVPNLSSDEIFPINPVVWSLFFELVANLAHRQFSRRLTTQTLAFFTAAAALVFLGASVYFGGAGIGPYSRDFVGGFARVAWGYSVGILLYRISLDQRFRVPTFSVIIIVLATIALLFAPAMGIGKLRVALSIFVGFPLVVIFGAHARQAPAWFERPLNWLGDISYPLYAIHWPMLIYAVSLFGRNASALTWLGVFATILLAATATEYLIDAPVRRWAKAKMSRRGHAEPVALG